MASKEPETSSHPDVDHTTPKAILLEILTSLLLLGGTWAIENAKALFPEPGPPIVLLIILNLSELTLLGYFLIAFLRAVALTYREFDALITFIRSSQTSKSVESLAQKIARYRIKALQTSITYKLTWLITSFLGTLFVAFCALVSIGLSGTSFQWTPSWISLFLISGIAVLMVIYWFNLRARPMLAGSFIESSTIGVSCLIQVLCLVTFLYISGYSLVLGSTFHSLITAIYLDRVGLILNVSIILVFAMILSTIISILLDHAVSSKLK